MSGDLVLTRRPGEGITIEGANGEPMIHIRVNEIKGQQARIAINAPRELAVLRDELYRRKTDPHE